MDETQGVQVKLCYRLTMRAKAERLRDVQRYTNRHLPLPLPNLVYDVDSWTVTNFGTICSRV